MTQEEAPEFFTKPLSPLSPLPVHPPEPEKIAILQKQTDPIFNMTSTHLAPDPPNLAATADPIPEPAASDSPSSHSSFSDAYAEQPEDVNARKDDAADQGTEVSDDYAMTFESDAEDQADNDEDSSKAEQPDTRALYTVEETSSASIGFTPAAAVPTTGQDIQSPTIPFPTHTSSNEVPEAPESDEIVAQPTAQPVTAAVDTFDDSAGGIDIQQLLDNITANAEKNAPQPATATPPTPSAALPKSSSSLPTHSSLPPRPNIPQKRPFHEDIQKYHAGGPGVPPASAAFRAATTGSLVGAGAPGTSTDPRGGLPPPPAGSFQAPGLSTGNISPAS